MAVRAPLPSLEWQPGYPTAMTARPLLRAAYRVRLVREAAQTPPARVTAERTPLAVPEQGLARREVGGTCGGLRGEKRLVRMYDPACSPRKPGYDVIRAQHADQSGRQTRDQVRLFEYISD